MMQEQIKQHSVGIYQSAVVRTVYILKLTASVWSICRYWVCKELCQNGRICQNAGKSAGESMLHFIWLAQENFTYSFVAFGGWHKDFLLFIQGIHAFLRDLHGCFQKWHWVQPAGTSDRSSSPKQQIHAGTQSHKRCSSEMEFGCKTKGFKKCLWSYLFVVLFFIASSYQKEWAG